MLRFDQKKLLEDTLQQLTAQADEMTVFRMLLKMKGMAKDAFV
jgi:hypothetical protein